MGVELEFMNASADYADYTEGEEVTRPGEHSSVRKVLCASGALLQFPRAKFIRTLKVSKFEIREIIANLLRLRRILSLS
jgi:hypothetical protein